MSALGVPLLRLDERSLLERAAKNVGHRPRHGSLPSAASARPGLAHGLAPQPAADQVDRHIETE